MPENDRLLTTEEVADVLSLEPATVRDWFNSGILPGIKLPGKKAGWRMWQSQLSAWLEQRQREAEEKKDRAA